MPPIKERLLASPGLLSAAGRMIWLIGQSDNPYAFFYYCKEGDIERAFDTIDMSNEEIHEEITALREEAEEAARGIPGFREASRDELYN